MKKIINAPERVVDDMLRGMGKAHAAQHIVDDPLGCVDDLLHFFLSASGSQASGDSTASWAQPLDRASASCQRP